MPATPSQTKTILALDVGNKRVGVARASLVARLPEPLTTMERGDNFFADLQKIADDEAAEALVVGLPRGLSGQTTEQTKVTEAFVAELKRRVNLPIHLQDEALTSQKAHVELQSGGKQYRRADVDALAATYILEDFLAGQTELSL